MGKNIILCSDGTGNKGGHGADTNVFRLFNAVDIHNRNARQITFYDDGVGTSKNRYLRAISGAFGFGFKANVRDLYEFLARNYQPDEDDKIFLFGFSRGAATVRAFAGMVQECGLLDIKNPACQKNGKFDEEEFQKQIELAVTAYEQIKTDKSLATAIKERSVKHQKNAPDGALQIEMIGVWDTVSALGFPQDWSWAFHWIFKLLDKFSEPLFPHNFYNYQLNENVAQVYHALAIDDERTTFHPKVWNEKAADRPKEIEQAWFAGVHSNVGGGYPRAGMSMVALDWMMARAAKHGIRFNKGAHDEVRAAANVDGRLYDSRAGAAIYYRYGPRDITELCKHVPGPVKIHESVIDRLIKGTSRFAPRSIPYEIEIVKTEDEGGPQRVKTAETEEEYAGNRQAIWKWVAWRKRLYRVFLESTVLLLFGAGYLWIVPPDCTGDQSCAPTWITRHFADFLSYVLPKFFDGFIKFFAIEHPYYLLAIVAYFAMLRVFRNRWRRNLHAACERARQSLLKQISQDGARAIDVEEVPGQEADWRNEIAALTVKLQEKRKPLQDGEVLRGVHPKSHGCVDADFIVNEDIGADYRVGLFTQPGKRYKAKIRYSNAAVLILPDMHENKNGSRGMAIKVFDVGSPVLLEDNSAESQDFLMINTPEFAFGNVRDYRRLSRALMADPNGASPDLFFLPLKLLKLGILDQSGKLKPPAENEAEEVTKLRQMFENSGVFEDFSPEDMKGTIRSFEVVQKIQQQTVRNPLQVPYFSASPFRFGPDRVMKFSVAPLGGAVPQPDFGPEEADALDDNYLAQALNNSLKQGQEIRLSFKVQVAKAPQLKGREKEMIEDASIAWSEEEFPFVEVAQIVIHPAGKNDQLVDACKSLVFTPWHALAAHEPLGGINRLRKPVYSKSAEARRGAGYEN